MSSIEHSLLQLLADTETPLYTAYAWLNDRIGRAISIARFLRLLDPLIESDAARLWAVNYATSERVRWHEIPLDLERRYHDVPDLDPAYDPFGLSLTLGPSADLRLEPAWRVDFDFDALTFRLTANPEEADVACTRVNQLFPDLDFAEDHRTAHAGQVRITGSIVDRT